MSRLERRPLALATSVSQDAMPGFGGSDMPEGVGKQTLSKSEGSHEPTRRDPTTADRGT